MRGMRLVEREALGGRIKGVHLKAESEGRLHDPGVLLERADLERGVVLTAEAELERVDAPRREGADERRRRAVEQERRRRADARGRGAAREGVRGGGDLQYHS